MREKKPIWHAIRSILWAIGVGKPKEAKPGEPKTLVLVDLHGRKIWHGPLTRERVGVDDDMWEALMSPEAGPTIVLTVATSRESELGQDAPYFDDKWKREGGQA